MPHLESKTKLIMTASVNWYINPKKYNVYRYNTGVRRNALRVSLYQEVYKFL